MYRSFDDVVFADTAHGWVAGQDAGLYATTDAGRRGPGNRWVTR